MSKLPLKVDESRWKQAQTWELEVWRNQNPTKRGWLPTVKTLVKKSLRLVNVMPMNEGNDWNDWWADKFEMYQSLPAEFNNVIEVGCGPYTNMRIVRQGRSIQYMFCSDPLALHYLQFKGRWLAEAWKSGQILVDNHPLEETPFASDYFDLAVMINVLDHVRDSMLCMRQVMRIVKPGGYLVVGQDLSDVEDVRTVGEDVGHPIRIDQVALDQMFIDSFDQVFYKILPREEGRNPSAHYGTYLFIGRKHISAGSR